MVPSLSRTVSRSLSHLLLAGAAFLCLTGVAAAQSGGDNQPPPAGGGLILPGTVQTAPQGGSPAAGTIGGPAAGTIGGPAAGTIGQPQPQAPAAGTVGAAAQGQAGAAAPARPATPPKPGVPRGEWRVEPQVFTDGSFKMCAAAVEFDNNLHLLLLRNPAKRVQMVLGIPGAQMPPGQRTAVRLSIDGKINRELGAIVNQPNALAIGLGDDAEILKGLGSGNVMTLEVPGDVAAFQLKGTTKAMNELTTCVDQGVAGTLKLPPPSEPVIAPTLAQLLVDAGLSSARAIPIDKIPPQQRPGDYAWQIGDKVLGAVRSFPMGEAAGDFNKVADTYLTQLKQSCEGTFNQSMKAAEKLPAYHLRSGSVTCDASGSKIHVAIVMQLIELPKQQGQTEAIRVLNIFSHEAADADKAQADNAAASILKVLKEKGQQPLTMPTAGAAPAAGGGRGQ
ncbi:hypothetical protein [Niveispirillum fermenti]|uniref:hypothetical protein n=1 Tax=Niveispirillum fermenti TaxID=1233113 RepID=UPI003A841C0D